MNLCIEWNRVNFNHNSEVFITSYLKMEVKLMPMKKKYASGE